MRSALQRKLTLVPRSLLWRTFLLVALVMLLSVVAWFSIYSMYDREPRARQVAQLVASVANLTRAALLAARSDARVVLLRELSDREGISLNWVKTMARSPASTTSSSISVRRSSLPLRPR